MKFPQDGSRVVVLLTTHGVVGSSPAGSLGVGQELEITPDGDVCIHLPFSIAPQSWSAMVAMDTWVFR